MKTLPNTRRVAMHLTRATVTKPCFLPLERGPPQLVKCGDQYTDLVGWASVTTIPGTIWHSRVFKSATGVPSGPHVGRRGAAHLVMRCGDVPWLKPKKLPGGMFGSRA